MRRRTNPSKKADAILAADLHIRSDTPMCRTDDYLAAQFKKLEFIFELCRQNDCPLLVAGDIGDKSQWPNWLLEKIISMINEYDIKIICIPGQHDLPEHRISAFEKSGVGVLHTGNTIECIGIFKEKNQIINCHFASKFISEKYNFHITPFSYGTGIKDLGYRTKYETPNMPMICMTHQMVLENKPLWPGQEAPRGNALLKKFPEYDLILVGDNHNPFVSDHNGRLLVNPGSMMRMTAAQINHKPRVYKWYANTNTAEAVYLPIEKGVVTRLHIEDKEIRDKRMDAFVSRMTDDFEIGLSFENNLEEYFRTNRTKLSVKDKTWNAVGVN